MIFTTKCNLLNFTINKIEPNNHHKIKHKTLSGSQSFLQQNYLNLRKNVPTRIASLSALKQ